jgi:hypothetical protein
VPPLAVVDDVADAFDVPDDPHAATSINIVTTTHPREGRTPGS